MLHEIWQNFTHNLFKPLLLFFYLGFLIPMADSELNGLLSGFSAMLLCAGAPMLRRSSWHATQTGRA